MALTLDFEAINQGETFSKTFQLTDSDGVAVDLTGVAMKMQIKDDFGGTLIYEMSTTNGRIVVTPLTGTFVITATASATALFTAGTCVYDLLVTWADASVERLFQGTTTITPGVTS